VHVLLARAHGATHGVCAAHWVGRDRPDFERRLAERGRLRAATARACRDRPALDRRSRLRRDARGERCSRLGGRWGRTDPCSRPAIARPGEHAARLHTAGDEFALLLPGVGEEEARLRVREIERSLDGLALPDALRSVYHGASVGHATRRSGETSGQALGRAVSVMRRRKEARVEERTPGG
jgi:hypothetical protein